ncbi:MAG: tetratricopeptide repeat protein [Mucilaginibacter sp.]
MDTYFTIEEKYLQAVDELSYGETPKGLRLLNEIINSDPTYARAHYQLGRIFFYDIKDYQAAGYHFQTCAELEPSFPDVYEPYLELLVFLKMERKAAEIAAKALAVAGVSASAVYKQLGLLHEMHRQWNLALQAYRDAFMEVTDKGEKHEIEDHITRVRQKMQRGASYQYHIAD